VELPVTPWLMGENTRNGESVAQRPQRSQRGELVGLADGPLFLTSVTLGGVFPVRAFHANKPRCSRILSPIILCDLRDLCAMLSKNSRVSRPSAMASPKPLPHNPPPSVTSVTSVRCLSPIRAFPAHQLPLKASLTYELNQSRK
jgi:hypothetical protein